MNEDAVGSNLVLKAELQRVKVQLAALQGQGPALDMALATSLAFDDQPNTAAAQAAQVSTAKPLLPCPRLLMLCLHCAQAMYAAKQAQTLQLLNDCCDALQHFGMTGCEKPITVASCKSEGL